MEQRMQLGPAITVHNIPKAVFAYSISGMTTARSYNDGLIGVVTEVSGSLFIVVCPQRGGLWQTAELFVGDGLAISDPHFFCVPFGSATIVGQMDCVAVPEEYPLAFQAVGEVQEVSGNTAICAIFAGAREIVINIGDEMVEVGEELLLTVHPTGDMIMADHKRKV